MEKDKVGRPLKFKNVKQLIAAGTDYFEACLRDNLPITITGLCIALDTTRDVLIDYQSGKYDGVDKFSNTIKKLKLVCENYAEKQLYTGKNPSGAIFALKNYGWTDKQEIEHSTPPDRSFNVNITTVNAPNKLDTNPKTE